MNRNLKKLFLMLIMCISLCSTCIMAFAKTEYVDGYLRYTVEESAITITGYNGKEEEVTIPSKIAGVPVSVIASNAFRDASTVTKVNLPDTIMTIEEGAFTVGQTVVYNSNTNEEVVTEPSEDVTEETKEENKEDSNESAKEDEKETSNESAKEEDKENSNESTKEENKEVSNDLAQEEGKEDIAGSAEEQKKEENKESEKATTTEKEEDISGTEQMDVSTEEVEVKFEDLESETSQNTHSESATTGELSTDSEDTTKASGKWLPLFLGVAGIVVVFLGYKKKSR